MDINRSNRFLMVGMTRDIKWKTMSLEELSDHILLCSNLQLFMCVSPELLHSGSVSLASLLAACLVITSTGINGVTQKERESRENEYPECHGHVRASQDFQFA